MKKLAALSLVLILLFLFSLEALASEEKTTENKPASATEETTTEETTTSASEETTVSEDMTAVPEETEPSRDTAVQDLQEEVEANVQTDISDLTNDGRDSDHTSNARSEEWEDYQLLTSILKELNNPVYSDTLAALQDGETITQGTKSDAAKGLQQMLKDFGCDIDIDGSAGPNTFAALNDVLSTFDKERASKVDADLYTELLKLLLISANEETAGSLLINQTDSEQKSSEQTDSEQSDSEQADSEQKDPEQTDDSDGLSPEQFSYLRGCALFLQEKYYSAKEAFEKSEYQDYQERAEKCEQSWPENGELWHMEDLPDSDMVLNFQVNNFDDSSGRFFKVYNEDNTLVSALFITGSGTVTTELPGGIYRILDATGETWYGIEEAFGPDGYYEYMVFNEYEDDPYKTWLGSDYEWDISINITSSDGSYVGSEALDWNNWVE